MAEMVADVALATAAVVTEKVALELPPDTVTLAGAVAVVELLLNATGTPPLGAVPLNVTVPREAVPPVTLVGLKDTETRFGNTVIVTVATLLLFVPSLAEYVKLSLPT